MSLWDGLGQWLAGGVSALLAAVVLLAVVPLVSGAVQASNAIRWSRSRSSGSNPGCRASAT